MIVVPLVAQVAGTAFLRKLDSLLADSKENSVTREVIDVIREAAERLADPPYQSFRTKVAKVDSAPKKGGQTVSPGGGLGRLNFGSGGGSPYGKAELVYAPAPQYANHSVVYGGGQFGAPTPQRNGGGGGVGLAELEPGRMFPAEHFALPYCCCSNARHSGNYCWSQWPVLRGANAK